VPGVNQMQVRPEIGLTFASALRHVLRQDPDVIMVGEIRDLDTAEIAIRASLTGHLVFSTIHTNDAAGAYTRLVDMGVEPFLVASAIELVIAQRLVRRLCSACARPQPVNRTKLRNTLAILGLDPAEADATAELMAPGVATVAGAAATAGAWHLRNPPAQRRIARPHSETRIGTGAHQVRPRPWHADPPAFRLGQGEGRSHDDG